MLNKRVVGAFGKQVPVRSARTGVARLSRSAIRVAATAATDANLGFKTMRDGVKVAADESLLTPRFYTTDFDEMERLFNLDTNKNLDMAEFEAMLSEFKLDYNQRHFVRNEVRELSIKGHILYANGRLLCFKSEWKMGSYSCFMLCVSDLQGGR